MPKTHRARLFAAFAAVYVIWGSTYLAIRLAIDTLPPFLMAGVRFLVAGGLLYAWARRRAPRPTTIHWRSAAVVGGLMMMGGNGLVTWSEQHVPSGVAALVVALMPIWLVLLDAVFFRGPRPTNRVLLGLAGGVAGVAVLVGVGGGGGGEHALDPLGLGVLFCAPILWALGSLFSRRLELPKSLLLGVSMEMLAGGAICLIPATLLGEWSRFDASGVSLVSAGAWAYLVLMGSIVALSAYVYLLRHTAAAAAGTYAFVNPIIAVVLGWAVLSEPLGPRTLVATALIVGAVALTLTSRGSERRAARAAVVVETVVPQLVPEPIPRPTSRAR